MGVQRVTPHSVGRCHEVTEGTALLGVIPLAGRCARKGRALPEKQSGQQSESGRPLLTSPPGLTGKITARSIGSQSRAPTERPYNMNILITLRRFYLF